jgi:hypothetical protein
MLAIKWDLTRLVLISQQKCSILGWKQEHFKKFKGPGVGVACAAPNMHRLMF